MQIARKHRGVRTIVEHIGSAHDDAQLVALVRIAKERITAGQFAFDLDALTPTAPTGVAPIVTGSRSRVLWDLLEATYQGLGFAAAVDDDTFMELVLARVVEPTSRTRSVSSTILVFRRRRCGRSGGPSLAASSRTGGTSSPPRPTPMRPAVGR